MAKLISKLIKELGYLGNTLPELKIQIQKSGFRIEKDQLTIKQGKDLGKVR